MSNKILLSSNICSFDKLVCLICTFDKFEKPDRSAPSNFHHQILKSRILLFSVPELLVSPSCKNDVEILIICHKETYENGQFMEHLIKTKITVKELVPVNSTRFEACVKYTLIAKLAPLWNQLETNVLVKGRDFLSVHQFVDAICLNAFVFENSIIIEITCMKVRLASIDLKDLNVTHQALDYFYNVPNSVLSETSLLDQWIHVLPSLKKGRIISVSKDISKTSLFHNYKDLRRHWKNIYGYRLPENPDRLFYVEVHFRPLGPQLYTYPSICLQTNYPAKIFPSKDVSKNIAGAFLHDINRYFSQIIGQSTNFHIFDDGEMMNDIPLSVELSPMKFLKKVKLNNQINLPDVVNDIDIYENDFVTIDKNITQNNNGYFSIVNINSPKPDINFNSNNNAMLIENISDSYLTQNISLCTPTQKVPNVIQSNKKCNKNWLEQLLETKTKNTTFVENKIILPDNEIISPNNKVIFPNNFKNSQEPILKTLSQSSTSGNVKNVSEKKKRLKPVDENASIDIPLLAKTNKDSIEKLNVRTLYVWLRSQNVHVTTKMVKQQLLKKIYEHLNI